MGGDTLSGQLFHNFTGLNGWCFINSAAVYNIAPLLASEILAKFIRFHPPLSEGFKPEPFDDQ